MSFSEYYLGEIAEFSQGIQVSIEQQYESKCNNMVRFLRIVDYTKESEPIRFINDPGSKYHVKEDDLVMIRYGSKTAGKVVKGYKGVIANNMFKISLNRTKIDKTFAYYLLANDKVYSELNASQSSSTMPAITFGLISKLKVNLPPLQEQKAIANILSSLDEKIELNNQMNKTLEEMAHSLFKRWFIDFEFPNENGEPYKSSGGEMVESELGMIPKGWRIYSIDELCDLNKSNYSIKEEWEYINYLDTANITNNKIDNIQKIDCENEKVPSRAKRKVKRDSIVYSTVRPNQLHYGIIKNPIENMIVSTGFVVLDSKIDFIKNDIIYYWLIQDNNTELLQSIGETSTSTYPSIKPSDIGILKLSLPPKEIIKNLEDKFDKVNVLIDQLKREEKQLIELRDSLLPKLMSGEVRLEDIEASL